jgi:hypothetical protein
MRVIKIIRRVSGNKQPTRATARRSIREFTREFFAKENHWEFAIEALVFGALLAISAWPIAAAVGAISDFL